MIFDSGVLLGPVCKLELRADVVNSEIEQFCYVHSSLNKCTVLHDLLWLGL